MQYVLRRIPTGGLSAKGCYWDDEFTKSSPAAAVDIILAMKKMEAITNLEADLTKFHLYAPDEKVALECMKLCENAGIVTGIEGIKIHDDMNITFLKTPIGTDEDVEDVLEETNRSEGQNCLNAI